LPLARWGLLVVLLAGELALVTYRFDTGSLESESETWYLLFWVMARVLRVAVAVAVATALLIGWRFVEAFRDALAQARPGGRWWLPLAAHLGAFAGFYHLTAVVFEGGLASFALPPLWVAAWFALGLLVLAFWSLAALTLDVWARLARRLWVQCLAGTAVGVAAWGGGELLAGLWRPLADMTLWSVWGVLQMFSGEAVCQPERRIVGTESFAVSIAPQCSGYEGIGLVLVFFGAYLWIFRQELRFPAALLLLPVAAIASWLCNVARIAALIGIGAAGHPHVAVEGFHSQAGWLAFNGIALGLVALTQRLRVFARDPAPAVATRNPSALYLAPFLVLIASVMLTTAVSAGFDYLYPLRFVAVLAVAGCFARDYIRWRWVWSWPAVAMGVLVFVVWLALEPAAPASEAEHPTAAALAGMPWGWALFWICCRVAGAVLTVPFAEELAFRGYLPRRLLASDFERVPLTRFSWFAFLVSSVCFGLLHGRWLAGTLAGMGYGLVVYRRGQLSEAVLAHALTNALLTAYVLATGSWSLWS
jgi:exosortase E/protease (VPEID-CTERM system)